MKKQEAQKLEKNERHTRPSVEQEREALAFATATFRVSADKLQKGALNKAIKDEEETKIAFEILDRIRDCAASANTPPPEPASPVMAELLRAYSASLLERNEQLPPRLAQFAASFLREPNAESRPGPKKEDLLARDLLIGGVVNRIAAKWGFFRTRNRNNMEHACAVSIAKEALAAGANLHLSEDDIIKASDKFENLIPQVMANFFKHREVSEAVTSVLSNVWARKDNQETEKYQLIREAMQTPIDEKARLIGEEEAADPFARMQNLPELLSKMLENSPEPEAKEFLANLHENLQNPERLRELLRPKK